MRVHSLTVTEWIGTFGCFSYQTCQLLDTAIKESNELSPGWYIEAGAILEKCGDPTGPARAEFTACFADKSQPAARCLEQFGDPEPLKN